MILDYAGANVPLSPFRIGRDFLLTFITRWLYYGCESNALQRSLWQVSHAGVYLEYIQSLAKPERARVSLKDLNRWKDGGWMPFAFSSGRLRERLWEVKIGSHRVFYVIIEKREMVLLHAYKKQGQKLPVKERDIAIRRMKELLS